MVGINETKTKPHWGVGNSSGRAKLTINWELEPKWAVKWLVYLVLTVTNNPSNSIAKWKRSSTSQK